jgi:hypothetical protein
MIDSAIVRQEQCEGEDCRRFTPVTATTATPVNLCRLPVQTGSWVVVWSVTRGHSIDKEGNGFAGVTIAGTQAKLKAALDSLSRPLATCISKPRLGRDCLSVLSSSIDLRQMMAIFPHHEARFNK